MAHVGKELTFRSAAGLRRFLRLFAFLLGQLTVGDVLDECREIASSNPTANGEKSSFLREILSIPVDRVASILL